MNDRGELTVLDSLPEQFHCPGERHPVSRSIHLARLAAGHAACRQCERRGEAGNLPKIVTTRLRTDARRSTLDIASSSEIRGIYINELTRERMAGLVQQVLDIVDEERRFDSDGSPRSVGALQVVVGFDGRPSSPDLSVGVVNVLRQWTVDAIDVGQVSRPAFDFAVQRFRPHIGIYVTGGTHGAAWTGLDLLDAQCLPWQGIDKLGRFEQDPTLRAARVGRTPGRYLPMEINTEYQAAIALQFHGMRPLRLGVVCQDVGIRNTLRSLLEGTPCDVHLLQTGAAGTERSSKPLPDIVCERHLDLGVVIATDGRACQLYDETGVELGSEDLQRLLLTPLRQDDRERAAISKLPNVQMGERELRQRQLEFGLPVVADDAGRCWFLNETPACDAIQTLARTLEVLSLSERPASGYRLQPKAMHREKRS
ncbi:phosphohexomutase domain-containing protein [Planctomicrobium piriforme]|uniref:Phosphomannomutase n=1 Tax=Planctomicrobium piriforme TaxID=1576369 RepID=A0A1I3MPX3_9PLAN|nr:hypothetical protein [Planctomicrobium piriforme]SFI99037.1 Phosphomannomutase [Planctomicrobium piriforme]